MTAPWDTYQTELFRLGHGLPLWHPEPNWDEGRRRFYPVEVGTVGWMEEGKVQTLFNALKSPDHLDNDRGVPTDFEMLDSICTNHSDNILTKVVFSPSVKVVEADVAKLYPLLPADAAVDSLFKYTVSGDKAAMLILDPHGKSQSLASKGRIKDYMKRNIDRWVEFASLSGPGADKKEDDMVFISGVTTSSEWMVVALQGCGQEDKEILLSGDMNSLSNGGVRVNLSDAAATTVHCRFGPTSQGAHEGATDDPQHLGAKQCLFVHYYKMRRRLWFLTAIEAAAGPHVLPPGEDGLGQDAQSTSTPCPQDVIDASSEAGSFDPVGYLLDYILKHRSDAMVALASDSDLLACFPDGILPNDIEAGLERVMPAIEVDEDGVGTVVVPHGTRAGMCPYDGLGECTECQPKDKLPTGVSKGCDVDALPSFHIPRNKCLELVEDITNSFESSGSKDVFGQDQFASVLLRAWASTFSSHRSRIPRGIDRLAVNLTAEEFAGWEPDVGEHNRQANAMKLSTPTHFHMLGAADRLILV